MFSLCTEGNRKYFEWGELTLKVAFEKCFAFKMYFGCQQNILENILKKMTQDEIIHFEFQSQWSTC